jgi:spermidine synthase
MEPIGTTVGIRRAAAAAGAASLLAQVVLLREVLAFSQGNELVLGLGLGVWLCLTAAGSVLGARVPARPETAARMLGWLLGLAPMFYLGSLGCTELGRPDVMGGTPALHSVFLTLLVALLPACTLAGLAFAWASAASLQRNQTGIYVAETAGAAVAGLLFHFLLGERLGAVWILCVAGGACAAAAAGIDWPRRGKKSLWLPLAATALSLVLAPKVAESVEAARFPGERVLVVRPSRYGLLTVLARGQQRVFLQDGVLLFTSEDQIAAEESVHLPMLLHPAPQRVLLLGGGLGGGLVEAMRHHPQRIDYAEVDPGLLDLGAQYASAETRAVLSDSRVHVVATDGRSLLRRARQAYDLILIQAPVPQNALLARYSTQECFEEARRALAPGGILALATPGSDTYLGDAAKQRHASIWAALAKVFPYLGSSPGAETILWASDRPVDARPDLLVARLKERGLHLSQVGPTWLFDRLLPMNNASYRRALAGAAAVASHDFRPVVYLFGLTETLQRLSPGLARHMLGLALANKPWLAGGGILLAVGLVLALLRRRRAVAFAVAAAGAAGMSLQVVLLVAYQALRGHLYHGLGVLLAASMAGMAGGALGAGRVAWSKNALGLAVAGVAALALLAAAGLGIARAAPEAATAALVALLVAVGAGTGAVYPLAVRVAPGTGAGARMYAWDLVGAAAAALLTSLLGIPLLGLAPVALVCAAVCAVAAVANLAKG